MRTSPLLLVFDIAGLEACSASSSPVDAAHSMLALTKACGLRLQGDKAAHAFAQAGVNPRDFRRRLRFAIHERGASGRSDDALHRTPRSKRAFEDADRLAHDAALLNGQFVAGEGELRLTRQGAGV